jgi:hypothetical protein
VTDASDLPYVPEDAVGLAEVVRDLLDDGLRDAACIVVPGEETEVVQVALVDRAEARVWLITVQAARFETEIKS